MKIYNITSLQKKINTRGLPVLFLFIVSTVLVGQPSVEEGKVLYESKKFEEAERVFKEVTQKSPDYASAQYHLGRMTFDQKKYEDAMDYFEEATTVDPKQGDYFNWLGDTYAAIAREASMFKKMSIGPKALRAWEKGAEVDKKNLYARVTLVGTYLMAPAFMGGGEDKSKKVAAEAFLLLDEELKKTPDNYLYHYWYGKSSAIAGLNLNRGEECLKKYLTHTPATGEPSLAGAYMRLGQIKEKQGNKAEARKNFESALKLDGKLKEAREGLGRTSTKSE